PLAGGQLFLEQRRDALQLLADELELALLGGALGGEAVDLFLQLLDLLGQRGALAAQRIAPRFKELLLAGKGAGDGRIQLARRQTLRQEDRRRVIALGNEA